MSGAKHTPAWERVVTSDDYDALKRKLAEERDRTKRLAEALERLLGLVDELHPNGFPEGFWPYEAVAAARAALREASVEP
ncbi:MAG TPA: hypothetical protein VF158_02800 [Longimicrobiales bacterium]